MVLLTHILFTISLISFMILIAGVLIKEFMASPPHWINKVNYINLGIMAITLITTAILIELKL